MGNKLNVYILIYVNTLIKFIVTIFIDFVLLQKMYIVEVNVLCVYNYILKVKLHCNVLTDLKVTDDLN